MDADPEPLEPVAAPPVAPEVVAAEDGSVTTDGLQPTSRSESSTTFTTESGSTVTRLSSDTINVRSADGEWGEPNTSVSRDGERWRVDGYPLQPVFTGGGDEPAGVTVSREGHEVSFSLVGAGPGTVDAPFWWWDDWEQLTYRDVKPGIDLEYRVERGAVKESILLDAVPSGRAAWTWRLDTGALVPRLAEADAVEFVDDAGTVVMMVPTPVAIDSSGIEGERSDAESALRVALTEAADGSWRYTVTADREWLADPARAFPVRTNPTVMSPNSKNAYKSDGTKLSGVLHVGNTRENNTNRYWRSIVGFDYGSIPGQFIAGAQAKTVKASLPIRENGESWKTARNLPMNRKICRVLLSCCAISCVSRTKIKGLYGSTLDRFYLIRVSMERR